MVNTYLSYYKVNNNIFNSKLNAFLYADLIKSDIVEWIFLLSEYLNTYNWNIEPEETLDELYQIRAKELREKYDYIILMYSGGADSHNVLMS